MGIGILGGRLYKQLIGPDGYPYDTYPVHDTVFSKIQEKGYSANQWRGCPAGF